MKEILQYIRRKLYVRVSLWVVLFAAIIFIVALGFLFFQSREAVRQEAVNSATQILDKTSLRVESILNRVEVASAMTKWLVERHPDKADSMFVYSRGMLQNNPDFYNCSIAFEPYYFRTRAVTSRPTPSMSATAFVRFRAVATTTSISSWTGISCLRCSTSHAGRSLTSISMWLRTRVRW